jgi:transcriptional regulator with XRE-family HTH domain
MNNNWYNFTCYMVEMEITGIKVHFELATPDEIAREFGNRIRAHRLAGNLQQSELAARAGVSERALRNFERSGRGSFDLFLRAAMALGLIESMSNLFELKPKSIKDMERASQKRQRASRKQSE